MVDKHMLLPINSTQYKSPINFTASVFLSQNTAGKSSCLPGGGELFVKVQ